MLPTSARSAFTIFVKFETSGVHSVQSLLWHWYRGLCDVPGRLLTSCSDCWTRQLVCLVVRGSSTAVWSSWSILSSIASMHLSASSTSSIRLCVAVWTVQSLGISRHTAPQSPRLPQDIICVLPPVISLLCRLTVWVHRDVGLSLSPARWRGTHYRDICAILFTPSLFLDDYLRYFSFPTTSVCSALGAFHGVDALCKFTFYLLTYLND